MFPHTYVYGYPAIILTIIPLLLSSAGILYTIYPFPENRYRKTASILERKEQRILYISTSNQLPLLVWLVVILLDRLAQSVV